MKPFSSPVSILYATKYSPPSLARLLSVGERGAIIYTLNGSKSYAYVPMSVSTTENTVQKSVVFRRGGTCPPGESLRDRDERGVCTVVTSVKMVSAALELPNVNEEIFC